ncbi:PIN domain-containing protein [Azotobacter bryophylli]|uniref:PIN domain-containing protein n=1 Tax=Azotobacter bryophylli TaxID=1986537 RepID=A0ABV7B0Y6_9GAMM
MRTNYILVDYENVQPKDIGLLQDGPFKVKVFLGPTQAKIPVSLATSLQVLGTNAEYIQLETAGSNALDFHIAYYIGVLATEDPTGFFHIISKDTGFDPLIKHLKARRIFAQRSLSIAEIPYFKATAAEDGNKNAWVDAAVADLVRRKASKPRTQKTLLSTLDALFRKELSPQQLSELLDDLCVRGLVRFNGARITYSLPSEVVRAC